MITILTAAAVVFGMSWAAKGHAGLGGTTGTTFNARSSTSTTPVETPYPLGVADAAEPSGMAPPTATSLPGYVEDYVNDFNGTSLPAGWVAFKGQPGGDPGALWAPTHVAVNDGLLRLTTSRDSAFGDAWVSGGVCECAAGHTYGAFFVRSRSTAVGPNAVELLWPVAKVWPPEIDFFESSSPTLNTATIHFDSTDQVDQRQLTIDATSWHTWGVIWSPTSIVYTVDGQQWGSVTTTAEIPDQAMTLDIDAQTFCSRGWGCPTVPSSMLVDWVAEYQH